jgi:NAD(P)H-flavin reductase
VIHLYISFRDEASSFAVDLAEATAKLHPSNLKLYTRIGQQGYELNAEFWRNMLPLHLAEKAWICGPPMFNRKIEKILIEEGFNPGKILLL